MNAYSKDLRLRVLAALDRGMPRKEIVRTFDVSIATIGRYLRRRREGADLAPRPSTGRTPIILADPQRKRALWEQLEGNSTATLEHHCELWEKRWGVKVSISSMSRAIRKLGWSRKKIDGCLRAKPKSEKCLARESKASRSAKASLRG